MIHHTAAFADGEYAFRLSAPMVLELERKIGPIGAAFARIFNRTFALADLHELIRHALIGAGTSPARAAELIAAYVVDRPLSETYPIAVAIAEATWFGQPNEQV